MEKRPQHGPDALRIDITPMPRPEFVMLETNVNMAANAALLAALDAVTGVESADLKDEYTVALRVDEQVPKAYLAGLLEDCVRQHCQL